MRVVVLALVTACTGTDDPQGAARAGSEASIPPGVVARGGVVRSDVVPPGPRRLPAGYVVDSILPPEEELRRFHEGLDAPAALADGAASREALVRRFMDRLAARDTTALRRMTLSRAEFAYLVFPGSAYTRPPYRTPPGLVWLQFRQSTAKGLRRLVRDETRGWRYRSHRCDDPVADGGAQLWRGCRVRLVTADGDPVEARLFGVIVEVDGRYKFASLETDF